MRRIELNIVSPATQSDPIVLDQYIAPGNVVFTVIMTAGTSTTVAVQHTNDDIFASDYSPATGYWEEYTASPFPVALTAGNNVAEGVYAFAPKAIRFVLSSPVGSPTVRCQVVQAGIGGT